MTETKKQFRRRLSAWLLQRNTRGRKAQIFVAVASEPWAAPPSCFLERTSYGWTGWQ